MKVRRSIFIGIALIYSLIQCSFAAPLFQQTGNTLVMSNGNVVLNYNLAAGTTDFYWSNSKKISSFYSSYQTKTGYIKGTSYTSWSYATNGNNQAIITATGAGLPILKQYFTLDQNDNFLVRCEISGANLSANYMGAVIVDSTGKVDIGVANDNRALVVPFDNDGFVRYNAMPMNGSGQGFEVAAFYDNTSRNGLVVGSTTHDTWKTGIFFVGTSNKLSAMNVFGGATFSGDKSPHGYVNGNVVSSPTMFVGFSADWRVAMQNFTAENTNAAAPMVWTNGVPFGWNSWGVIQQNLSYTDAIDVSDYFFVNLINQNFSDNGIVYINLDAFWDNLSPSQLQTFAAHCHAHGEKAGIYMGPFVWFGNSTNAATSYVEGTSSNYFYSAALLRDQSGRYVTNDGGLAMDPTHPATKLRNNYYVNLYTNWGFDYIKLDFLSHGALEGVFYDTNVTTGIQAYNEGMQYVTNSINGRMFISESIAPLFPYQYANSRRIACDAQTSAITDTEYTMNSVSYGWWMNGLYQFNDPDIMVFGNGTDTNEAQSRYISGAVTGVFLNGDDLTTANGQNAAHGVLTNAAIDGVARVGHTFTPVEGNTGTAAENIFMRQDGNVWSLAVFNYTSSPVVQTVNFSRAGLPSGNLAVTNLWDGSTSLVSNSLSVSLAAKQSKLFQLAVYNPASLRWSSRTSGVWDTSVTANWLNNSTGLSSVFNPSDSVSFNDSPVVATNLILTGALSPGSVLINTSINQFSFGGTGKITGAGSLMKQGSSALMLNTTNDFTGPVTVSGGTLLAGNGALNSIASLTITNGGTLDLAGNTISGNKLVIVAGGGVGNLGTIYNSGNDFYNQMFNITLAGDSIFGGTHRWDLANGSSVSGPFNLTMILAGGYTEWDSVNLASNVGNLEVKQGAFGIKGMGNTFGDPNATLTVDSEIDFWNGNFGTNSGYAKNIHLLSGGSLKVLTSPNTCLNANIVCESNAQFTFAFGSGSQTMNGPITLNGTVHFMIQDSTVIFTNVISGPGGFVWDVQNNNLVLSASNTFTGPSVIGNGLTLLLSSNGSITKSSPIFFGGTDSTVVHIDVNARPDKTFSLNSGQTLAGIGAINGNLTVNAGATISPGGTNTTLGITTGANPIGTISAATSIVLQGATTMKLNGSGVSDSIRATNGMVIGGTLNLVNISPAPLAAGNNFQILASTNISGSFSNINPAIPGNSLLWDVSQLSAGKLAVMAASPRPVVNSVKISGTNIILAGSNGIAGNGYNLLGCTNLSASSNWTIVSTNAFDGSGNFRTTNPVTPGVPQQFYRLQLR